MHKKKKIKYVIVIVLFYGYFALVNGLTSLNNEPVDLTVCTDNKTISIKFDGDLCQCEPEYTSIRPQIRDDYDYFPKVGAYKLHVIGKVWNEARKTCRRE